MANSFLHEESGASLAEYLLIIPLLITTTFAVIDMGLLMWQWNQAAKATHVGTRMAVTRDPAAIGVNVFTNPDDTAYVGRSCTLPDGSLRIGPDGITPLCPDRVAVCTSAGCPGWNFDSDSFMAVFNVMNRLLPMLEPENVQIIYSSVGLGFVDRPGGSPVAVTVSLRCMGMELIFLDTFFPATDGCPDMAGAPIPPFATTLIGEDLSG